VPKKGVAKPTGQPIYQARRDSMSPESFDGKGNRAVEVWLVVRLLVNCKMRPDDTRTTFRNKRWGASFRGRSGLPPNMFRRAARSKERDEFHWLLLGVLTAWRITHFLWNEDGPWDIVIRLRRQAGKGFFGKLLDCFYCLSVWISAPLACLIGKSWSERVLLWPAFSAGAILLQRVTDRGANVIPAPFTEDPAEKDSDVMLRETERANAPTKSID
jgi:hypothetical protein